MVRVLQQVGIYDSLIHIDMNDLLSMLMNEFLVVNSGNDCGN